jgi:hypothetical protein
MYLQTAAFTVNKQRLDEFSMVFYNNLLSLPFIVLLIGYYGEVRPVLVRDSRTFNGLMTVCSIRRSAMIRLSGRYRFYLPSLYSRTRRRDLGTFDGLLQALHRVIALAYYYVDGPIETSIARCPTADLIASPSI